jgi:flagellar hook assembly protein FlgD
MRTLVEGELEAGDHQVVWDGRTENGQMAASGTYYYELEIGAIRTARKALLLR